MSSVLCPLGLLAPACGPMQHLFFQKQILITGVKEQALQQRPALHRMLQALDQPSALVRNEIRELRVSEAFIFKIDQ